MLRAREEEEWRQRLQSKKKLAEYRVSKKKLQRERYLELVEYALDRRLYAELRLGILKVRRDRKVVRREGRREKVHGMYER